MSTLEHVGSCKGGNTIPLDPEGRPYHYGCTGSEISNYFLICSCYDLAEKCSKLFDSDKTTFIKKSNRGYHTYTGYFNGKRISICGFGIGFAMIDFLLREIRAITTGKLVFIQIGEAPTPLDIPLGTAVNVKDAVAFEIDYNEFKPENKLPYRIFSKPVPANQTLFNIISESLKITSIPTIEGRTASNPSFVAGLNAPLFSKGGTGAFNFRTEGLLEKLVKECGEISTFEMDAYPLLWTSLREVDNNIDSAVVSIVSSDFKGNILKDIELQNRQLEVAKIILDQLSKLQ